MTSKCDKNRNMVQRPPDKCVTDVLTTHWCLLWSITEQMHSNIDSTNVLYIEETKIANDIILSVSNCLEDLIKMWD